MSAGCHPALQNLIHIFAELAAIHRMQAFGLFDKHVDEALGELAHQRRQRNGRRDDDPAGRGRRLQALFERISGAFADDARVIRSARQRNSPSPNRLHGWA